jgi:hypothetical protein
MRTDVCRKKETMQILTPVSHTLSAGRWTPAEGVRDIEVESLA